MDPKKLSHTLAAASLLIGCGSALASGAACKAESAATVVPVIELYTSEGCSSCPPADRWLSSLKPAAASGRAVVQAFHVGYWDYIGWVDRFANAAYTQRQKQVASWNGTSSIYTPQLIRDGRDSRDYAPLGAAAGETAKARIVLQKNAGDAFEASVSPGEGVGAWAAYWTVTENGHASKVKAGENAGEYLQHDFVVRQYVPAGEYRGASKLTLRSIAADPQHERRVNLVVYDPKSGKTLQAIGMGC